MVTIPEVLLQVNAEYYRRSCASTKRWRSNGGRT